MTVENFLSHIDGKTKKEIDEKETKQGSFIDFMLDCINKENINHETKRQRLVSLRDVEAFGKLKTFADLTPSNIKDYDLCHFHCPMTFGYADDGLSECRPDFAERSHGEVVRA